MKQITVILLLLTGATLAATWDTLATFQVTLGSEKLEIQARSKRSYRVSVWDKHVVNHITMDCSPRTLLDLETVYKRARAKAEALKFKQESDAGSMTVDNATWLFSAFGPDDHFGNRVFVYVARGAEKVAFFIELNSEDEKGFMAAIRSRW